MIAVLVPSLPTVEAALDWLERFGVIVRVSLQRGPDGCIRGNGLVRVLP
jgi:hypothetical protein